MRKLASIHRIWKIEPIDGADRIELAHVLGWQCVVNKGQFRPMDMGVYFEIDSFLPIRPVFEFLRTSSYRNTDVMGEGFRLRTMCHYPLLSWRHSMKTYMIHGHIHNDVTTDFWPLIKCRDRVLNAGVDINGFEPVTIEELIENNRKFKANH